MRSCVVGQKKIILPGELALLFIILNNSMCVVLMLRSGSGISAISSVPYAFSLVFPALTLGTWTYIFQGFLVLSLMVMRKRFVPGYLFSFVVGFAFGKMLDIHKIWINTLPLGMAFRMLYFAVSYFLLCFGLALANRCKFPIVPTDLFSREVVDIIHVPYPKVKITFDVSCLLTTAGITWFCLGQVCGLGIGTVAAALTMGKTIGMIGNVVDQRVEFVSVMGSLI